MDSAQFLQALSEKAGGLLYNRAEEWGEQVLINYKHDAFMFGTAVVDIERGQFADVKPYYWQTDTAVAPEFLVLYGKQHIQACLGHHL